MKILFVIFFLMLLMSTGCQHSPPDSWTEKYNSTTAKCPDISGIYFDIAIASHWSTSTDLNELQSVGVDNESSKKKTNECSIETISVTSDTNYRYKASLICSLNGWLDRSYTGTGSNEVYLCPLKSIKIEQPDDYTINVTNYENEKVVKKYTLGAEVGDFICQGGKIIFRPKLYENSGIYSTASHLLKREMFVAEDGLLVSNVSLRSSGLLVAIPLYEHKSIRFRWRKVDDTNAEQSVREMKSKCANSAAIESITLSSLNAYAALASQYNVGTQDERSKKLLIELTQKGSVEAAALLAIKHNNYQYLKELAISNTPGAEAWLYKSYMESSALMRNANQAIELQPIILPAIKGDANSAYQMWGILNAYPMFKTDALEWLCLSVKKGNRKALQAMRQWYPNSNESDCNHIQ